MGTTNDGQDEFLGRDNQRYNSDNPSTSLPRTLDATHLDNAAEQPYILDHLHSWKDLMRDSSTSRVRARLFISLNAGTNTDF